MTINNISIENFIELLKSFEEKGAEKFGMDISSDGKQITLFPHSKLEQKKLPPSQEDSNHSIINLKT